MRLINKFVMYWTNTEHGYRELSQQLKSSIDEKFKIKVNIDS